MLSRSNFFKYNFVTFSGHLTLFLLFKLSFFLPEARLKPARFLASEARQERTGARGFTILLHMMKLISIIFIVIIIISIINIAFVTKFLDVLFGTILSKN